MKKTSGEGTISKALPWCNGSMIDVFCTILFTLKFEFLSADESKNLQVEKGQKNLVELMSVYTP